MLARRGAGVVADHHVVAIPVVEHGEAGAQHERFRPRLHHRAGSTSPLVGQILSRHRHEHHRGPMFERQRIVRLSRDHGRRIRRRNNHRQDGHRHGVDLRRATIVRAGETKGEGGRGGGRRKRGGRAVRIVQGHCGPGSLRPRIACDGTVRIRGGSGERNGSARGHGLIGAGVRDRNRVDRHRDRVGVRGAAVVRDGELERQRAGAGGRGKRRSRGSRGRDRHRRAAGLRPRVRGDRAIGIGAAGAVQVHGRARIDYLVASRIRDRRCVNRRRIRRLRRLASPAAAQASSQHQCQPEDEWLGSKRPVHVTCSRKYVLVLTRTDSVSQTAHQERNGIRFREGSRGAFLTTGCGTGGRPAAPRAHAWPRQ